MQTQTEGFAPAGQEAVTPSHIFLIAICGLLSLADGFDSQVIAFAAAPLAEEFGISASIVGSIFAAGLFGNLVGALMTIRLETWLGRSRLLTLCLVWIAIGSLLTTVVRSGESLLALRFVTGIGLGMAIPLLLGIVTDSVPVSVRARGLAIVTCAIPAGGLLAGLLASVIIPVAGWRALFWVGFVLPLVLIPPMWKAMATAKIQADPQDGEAIGKESAFGARIRAMYQSGGAGMVIIIVTNFFSMLLAFSLMNWVPSLLVKTGLSTSQASFAGGLLNGGAMFATLAVGYLLDRFTPLRVGVICYALAACFLLGFGQVEGGERVTYALSFGAGFFAVGAQVSITYLIAHSVSAAHRVTVLAISMIASRTGGALGPLLLGFLVDEGLTLPAVFALLSGIAVIVIAGILLNGRLRRPVAA